MHCKIWQEIMKGNVLLRHPDKDFNVKATVVLRPLKKKKVKWEVKHHHCWVFNPPSLFVLNQQASLHDPLCLSSGWSDCSLTNMKLFDLRSWHANREARDKNGHHLLCPCLYNERSTDFTSGRVCGPSSFFSVVCRFQPMAHWTLAGDPPACRNLTGLGEGRRGALQHQVAGDGGDLRGRSLHWQPCR